MAKKLYFLTFILFLFIVLPLVSSIDTPITVKTDSGHVFAITLNVLDPTSGDALQTFTNNTDLFGQASFLFSATNSQAGFSVVERLDNKIVQTKTFDTYNLGSAIVLDISSSIPSTVNNASVTNLSTNSSSAVNSTNTNVTLISTNSTKLNSTNSSLKPAVSGFAFNGSQVSSFFNNIKYYILGLIVLIAILFLAWFFYKRRKNDFMHIPKSQLRSKEESRILASKDRQLENAERKIREAQEEIERIKNRKRQISEAEQRYEESRRELERLRRGGR